MSHPDPVRHPGLYPGESIPEGFPQRFIVGPPSAEQREALRGLRTPIPPGEVEKLPRQMWKGAWDGLKGAKCPECHGFHVLAHCIHLDYYGHAQVTNRLLEADPVWSWEPLAFTPQGLPLFDQFGGLWIRLTVCGVTRLGYGDAVNKPAGPTAVKEIIGDAIRSAAMRFGVALELWSKSDLHGDRNLGDGETPGGKRKPAKPARQPAKRQGEASEALAALGEVCDENGYDKREVAARYAKENGGQNIDSGSAESVYALAAKLLEELGDGPGGGEPGVGAGGEPAVGSDHLPDGAVGDGVAGEMF